MQRLEREVLELPLERVDAEPVRKRRVDLERLPRLLDLLLLAEVLDRADVRADEVGLLPPPEALYDWAIQVAVLDNDTVLPQGRVVYSEPFRH